MIVPMLKAISKMLEGDYNDDASVEKLKTKVRCAKVIIDEIIACQESPDGTYRSIPVSGVPIPLDKDLDQEAQKAKEELNG